jgi:hypothetical protein
MWREVFLSLEGTSWRSRKIPRRLPCLPTRAWVPRQQGTRTWSCAGLGAHALEGHCCEDGKSTTIQRMMKQSSQRTVISWSPIRSLNLLMVLSQASSSKSSSCAWSLTVSACSTRTTSGWYSTGAQEV